MTILVALLAMGNFVAVLVYVAKAAHFTTFIQVTTLKALSISVNALGAATDIVIAAALCYLLDSARTGFEQSDSMINRLMLFSVNTGLLTSICAIMSLIMVRVYTGISISTCNIDERSYPRLSCSLTRSSTFASSSRSVACT